MTPAELDRIARGLELLDEDLAEAGEDEERTTLWAQRRRLEHVHLAALVRRDREPRA